MRWQEILRKVYNLKPVPFYHLYLAITLAIMHILLDNIYDFSFSLISRPCVFLTILFPHQQTVTWSPQFSAKYISCYWCAVLQISAVTVNKNGKSQDEISDGFSICNLDLTIPTCTNSQFPKHLDDSTPLNLQVGHLIYICMYTRFTTNVI